MATRNEKVVLSLVDAGFSTNMAKAAAATALLDGRLDDLDGTRIDLGNGLRGTTSDLDAFGRQTRTTSGDIDTFSGRLGFLAKTAGALGPTLAPIATVGVAGVAGLANQFGFAAVAAGTAIAAFQGIGTTLEAVNKAALDPSVANLEAAHAAMKALTPAGRGMVEQLQSMRPILQDLQGTAQGALFPGLIDGLETLERLAPGLDAILTRVGRTLGDLFAEGAESLTSTRWADFFAMLAMNARPVLTDMAHALGSVVHGMSELWEAFMPLNRDFGSWLADSARSFDEWASGVSQTEGFQEFVAYIRENGPKVADATVAIANAVLQIGQAAAPLGGPVLDALTNIAEAIATIADSPLGTPIMAGVTALSALTLAANVATAATVRLNAAMATLGLTSVATGTKVTAAAAATGAGAAATGAAATATGLAARGGLAAGLATAAARFTPIGIPLALLDTLPDYIENLQLMASGERNVAEGLARMAAGANPVGAALNLLGVDILGTDHKAEDFASSLLGTSVAAGKLEAELDRTTGGTRRFSQAMFRNQRALFQAAQQAERIKEALKEQRAEVEATADMWGDYSQKVKVATGPDVETITRRWDRIGTAAADMAENIRDALERGIDPKVLKNVIDTLGPQDAAVALEQFANATGRQAERIERDWRQMLNGTRDFASAYDALVGLVNGNGLSLNPRGVVSGAKKGEQSIMDLADGVSGAILGLKTLDRQTPTPKADLDTSGVQGGVATVERLLTGLNGDTAHTYVYTHHITTRTSSTSPGFGPVEENADGGTIGGQRYPYRDKVLSWLAPGEEVISNRFGQADRHRDLLKAINANRFAAGGTVPLRSRPRMGGGSAQEVRHTFEVQVKGDLDLTKAKLQLRGAVRDAIDQAHTFAETQR